MSLSLNNISCLLIIVFVCCCFQSTLCGTGRNFFSQSLCKEDVGDCSPQVGATANTCQVYNNSASYEFDIEDEWTSFPITYPLHEKDAHFKVSVLPYERKHDPEQAHHESAINISLTSLSKEINGFYIEVSDPTASRTVYRIFDFSKAARIERKNISLYYDCLHSLGDAGIYSFVITAKALPLNEVLQYLMYMPNLSAIEPEDVCSWKPLIMVFLSSLEAKKVSVHFSKAPLFYGVQKYEVSLVSEDDGIGTVSHKSLKHESGNSTINIEFHDVDIGYYHVHITVYTLKDRCESVRTNGFYVSSERLGTNMGHVLGIIVFAIIFVIGISLLIRWSFRLGSDKGLFSRCKGCPLNRFRRFTEDSSV